MHWMVLPFRRYAEFSGRSQRKEFWMFILFDVLVYVGLGVVGSIAAGVTDRGGGRFLESLSIIFGLFGLWTLVSLVPYIAVSVRRLHDIGRTGWWLLLSFGLSGLRVFFVLAAAGGSSAAASGASSIAAIFSLASFVLSIVFLVWFCSDGTRGINRFGPDPKGSMADLRETFR